MSLYRKIQPRVHYKHESHHQTESDLVPVETVLAGKISRRAAAADGSFHKRPPSGSNVMTVAGALQGGEAPRHTLQESSDPTQRMGYLRLTLKVLNLTSFFEQ